MTDREKNEDCKQKPLILVAPLDWGMGHTIRCMPLISAFLAEGCEVVVACNSTQSEILRREFPSLSIIFLPGWGIRYGRSSRLTRWKLLVQAPKILTQIKAEKRWLRDYLASHRVSAVISDNRYGLQANGIPSIIITHQLAIETGFGPAANRLVNGFLRRRLLRFSECWVPDEETAPGMAGALSHPPVLPSLSVSYLGCLSRLPACGDAAPSQQRIGLLVVLSGPEPQRTILESLVLSGLRKVELPTVIVRGCPAEEIPAPSTPGHVTLIPYAGSALLHKLICQAGLVLCRSGYTSIMDLIKLRKKMILIPTPGQAEQEYLAEELSSRGMAVMVNQERFDIEEVLKQAAGFPFQQMNVSGERYKNVVQHFVVRLNKAGRQGAKR